MEFRLLEKTSTIPELTPSIELEGSRWILSDPYDIYFDEIPEYGCISYVWGPDRADNPIHPNIPMSTHTLPALCAVIRNDESLNAVWMDVFCVPSDPLLKKPTLESMGFIYGRAEKVIVVLQQKSFNAVKWICGWEQGDDFDESYMHDLEADKWIKSVWTYQEVVNSHDLYFAGESTGQDTSESSEAGLLQGQEFLNGLGFYLEQYRRHHQVTVLQLRQRFPNLDTFEDLIADWMVAAYCDRSAMEIMSNMSRRSYDDDGKNYFYSMIGAVTHVPSSRRSTPTIESLAETFMSACEEKGDYSFIFSSAERDSRKGFRWRPLPTMLQAVVSWHSQGEKLEGVVEAGGKLRLKDMVIITKLEHGEMSNEAKEIICSWMLMPELASESQFIMAPKFYECLVSIQYTGSATCIFTEHGMFWPQEDVGEAKDVEIWIAAPLMYVFGAPGIAVLRANADDEATYIPGVFAGNCRRNLQRKDVIINIA
ncbi:hypothetical protein ABKN59_002982 [Abortiporus biennis]